MKSAPATNPPELPPLPGGSFLLLSPARRTILWRYENTPYSHRYSAGRDAQPAGASRQSEPQTGTPLR
ncbi:hypothetical protein BN1200_140153 [Klebsiella variicola]|nr:hypothetical protein KVR801_50303 [Klebsiella variicola]CEP33352.1 hypothetical protein KV8917_90022 [Klebsiella variicola]CTQ00803.1 hypothetical protein BN1200_120060 [Klebsiella variicola]CTQ01828.1 hypothetical protein BN1200_140153 [Klebsiella variicola]CTQ07377.1 hypothetical protein BN1007_20276 [Klebsiella variicola]